MVEVWICLGKQDLLKTLSFVLVVRALLTEPVLREDKDDGGEVFDREGSLLEFVQGHICFCGHIFDEELSDEVIFEVFKGSHDVWLGELLTTDIISSHFSKAMENYISGINLAEAVVSIRTYGECL